MHRILHVDVFSAIRFAGNPLAVIVDDGTLTSSGMQRIANWLNLSESTFVQVLSPTSYRVRIFTPKSELPFAGHPSIGTAAALMYAGLLQSTATQLTQHCAAGALPVWRSSTAADAHWFVQAPSAKMTSLSQAAITELALAVGQQANITHVQPVVIDNGPRWAVAEFADASALLALQPDLAALAAWNQRHDNIGLAAFGRDVDANGSYLEVRCFVPIDGIAEDPVTGSGNAAIAAALDFQQGFANLPRRYLARQGRAVARDGIVLVSVDDDRRVAIGGAVQWIADGMMHIDAV